MSEQNLRDSPIDTGVIVLTGGRDVAGNLLLTFPTHKLIELEEWSSACLSTVFLRLVVISKYVQSPAPLEGASASPGVACVVDLRHASTLAIQQLVEALELVEHQQRGTIAAVYFLKPKSSSKSHILKKLLGLKPSKKRPRVPLFKIALLKTVQDLYTQIDVCHLTLDLCGTLKYSHHAWMHLHDVVVQCIEEGKDILAKLASIRDRVELLQEYEPDIQSSAQLQQLLTDLTEKFQITMSESGLPSCLTRSKQTLFQLDSTSSNTLLTSLHPSLLTGMHAYLRNQFTKLDKWNTSLEETWRVTESRFALLIQINKHKERAKEIERKICDHYHPLLKEHPTVGKTLSQAELYRAHFTTTLYEPAKELLSQATEILEAVSKLKTTVTSLSSTVDGGAGGGSALIDNINNTDFADISKSLTTSIQPFTNHMQQLQQVYVGIHIFHLLFEKALNWYKKVLKFIPERVLSRCLQEAMATYNSETSTQDSSFHNPQAFLVFMPPEWLGAVRVFLDRHPPPRAEHIDRLDRSPPYLVDRKLKAQARSLALRLRLLQRLMSNSRLPSKLVAAIIEWKIELFGSSHGADKSSSHSPLNSPSKERTRSLSSAQKSLGSSNSLPPGVHLKMSSNIKTENSALDNSDMKGQHRKPVTMDNNTNSNSSLPSSGEKQANEETESGTDAMIGKKEAAGSKVQLRKASSKTFLRGKSVEFSFNSSSTDGSVFDYEKAVSQARQAGHMSLGRDARLSHPKLAQRKNKLISDDERMLPWASPVEQYPDQVLSDPSFSSRKQDYVQPHMLSGMEDYALSFKRPATDGEDLHEYRFSNQHFLDVPKSSLRKNRTLTSKQMSNSELHLDRDFDINADDMSSSDERFIGLSSYVDPLQIHNKSSKQYRSMDNLLSTTDQNEEEEEAESGIDTTMENTRLDPYDSVVKRIKAISGSDLPNLEKLKKVSSIIANSSLTNNCRQTKEPKINSKLSFSTLDLRPIEEGEDFSQYHQEEQAFLMNTKLVPDRPVNAVQRMKENLAKSMEELNMYTQASTQKNSTLPSTKKDSKAPPKPARRRYVSKLNITPQYGNSNNNNNNNKTPIQTDVSMRDSVNFFDDRGSTSYLSPGLDSTPVADISIPSFETESETKDQNNSTPSLPLTQRMSEPWDGANKHERRFNESQKTGDEAKHKPPQRPSSLKILPGRNFISSSFMKLSTSSANTKQFGHENAENTNSNFSTFKAKWNPDSIQDYDTKANDGHQKLNKAHRSVPLETISSKPEDRATSKTKESVKTTQSQPEETDSVLRRRARFQCSEGTSVDPKEQRSSESFPYSRDSLRSSQADSSPELKSSWLDLPSADVERLSNEAEIELSNQEEVANSLKKTQMILEEEEKRRSNMNLYGIDDDDDEDEEDGAFFMEENNPVVDFNQSDTGDNGYGSWASKLISQPSTSSEGVDAELFHNIGSHQILSGSFYPSGNSVASRRRNFAQNSDGTSSSEKAHETPWLDSPTGDPPKF